MAITPGFLIVSQQQAAQVRQRSYSIHAVTLEYAKIKQVKERLLADPSTVAFQQN